MRYGRSWPITAIHRADLNVRSRDIAADLATCHDRRVWVGSHRPDGSDLACSASRRRSEDFAFRVGPVLHHVLLSESRDVDGSVRAVDDLLGDRAPSGRRVHRAVSGKARADMEIVQGAGPVPDDGVTVEFALLVQPRPGAVAPRDIEARETMGYVEGHNFVRNDAPPPDRSPSGAGRAASGAGRTSRRAG